MRRGASFGVLFGVLVTLAAAAPALGDESAPTWNCRASVAQLFGTSAQPRFEPLVANGDGTTGADRPGCADDREGLPAFDSPAGSPLTVHVQGPYAVTTVTPALAAARDQSVYAGTKTADLAVSTPDGQLTVTATALRAEAAAQCVDGVPHLDGSSTVVGLSINGQALPLNDTTLGQVSSQFDDSPFGGVIKVLVDQKTVTPDSVTVQALRVELFDGAGSPQGTLVLGEAKVTKQGDACAPPAQTTTGSGSGAGSPQPSPSSPPSGTGPSSPTTGSSTPGTVRPVVINGRNGGCGHLQMWIEKVDLVHHLRGHRHRATSRFGQRPLLRGRIVNCQGKPIVGARIDQLHYVGSGVGKLIKTGLRSRPGGKLTLILPLNLTTRTIVLRYRGNLASSHVTSKVVLHLAVRDRKGRLLRGRAPRHMVDA